MTIYTDGSAHPNPGPGGYGIVVLDDGDNVIEKRSRQYEGPVTNNEMELKAILYAVVKYGKYTPIIYTDSEYCFNIYNNWMYMWAQNNWIKLSYGAEIKNKEIIIAIYEQLQTLPPAQRPSVKKVKAHVGNVYNEMADLLATGVMKE